MTPRPHLIQPLLLAGLLALAAVARADAPAPGASAPDFRLPTLDGSELALSDLAGEVVMINFWASWCGPCRTEMPLLNRIHQRYERFGFTLLGVNVEQDNAAARAWLDEVPVDFPVLFDAENGVSEAFGVDAMPSTVLVGRDGRVRLVHRGYVPGDEVAYLEAVRRLVRE